MLLNSSVGNLSYTYFFFSVLFCVFFLLFLLGGWECREKYRVTKRMETVSSIIPGILYMSEIPKNRHLLCKAFRNVKRALGGKNEQKSRLLIKKKKISFLFFFLFFTRLSTPKVKEVFAVHGRKQKKRRFLVVLAYIYWHRYKYSINFFFLLNRMEFFFTGWKNKFQWRKE